jgi:hypothetical protein
VTPSALHTSGTTARSTHVSWSPVAQATTANVRVNGHLIDSVSAAATDSYQVQGLWPSTSFDLSVGLRNARNQLVARYMRTITTGPRDGSYPRLYAPDAFINTPIGPSPTVESNSPEMVAQAFENYSSNANLSNSNSWGIPVYNAADQSTSYEVGCKYYGCDTNFGSVHIPAGAQPQWGSDGDLIVFQPGGNEFDIWLGQHTDSGWTTGTRWLESFSGPATNCSTQPACGGVDVAKFALAAGMVRPEEIAQGHIDHALAITTPYTRQGYVACPAAHTDGKHADPNALPIGAHVQLDPSIDVAALRIPAWQKVVDVALQQYGAYVIDTGGSVSLYAESNLGRPYNAWAKAGVSSDSPHLSGFPWHSMRVLSMTQCGS